MLWISKEFIIRVTSHAFTTMSYTFAHARARFHFESHRLGREMCGNDGLWRRRFVNFFFGFRESTWKCRNKCNSGEETEATNQKLIHLSHSPYVWIVIIFQHWCYECCSVNDVFIVEIVNEVHSHSFRIHCFIFRSKWTKSFLGWRHC